MGAQGGQRVLSDIVEVIDPNAQTVPAAIT